MIYVQLPPNAYNRVIHIALYQKQQTDKETKKKRHKIKRRKQHKRINEL